MNIKADRQGDKMKTITIDKQRLLNMYHESVAQEKRAKRTGQCDSIIKMYESITSKVKAACIEEGIEI
jgi:hypothetical protein